MTVAVALSHRFGGFDLDVAFEAGPGITVLFGRSGAGKTTVINALAGLLKPAFGRVHVADRVLLDTERGVFIAPHRRRVACVFQDARLFPHLSVRQNLRFGRWFTEASRRRADEAHIVALLGLEPLLGRRPAHLSGGERQRVALGRALLADPDALLLDEPLAALDEPRKADILPHIERLRDELRIPVVYVSHAVAEVTRLADTVVVLGEGRVQAIGAPEAVMSDPALVPAMGEEAAGSVLAGRVVGHDERDGLTTIAISGGEVLVGRLAADPGTPVRLRVRGRDLMLALTPPQGISALNVLPVRVVELGVERDGMVPIQLACGSDRLLAQVTRRSVRGLGLAPGLDCYAVLKSIAVGRDDIARWSAPARPAIT